VELTRLRQGFAAASREEAEWFNVKAVHKRSKAPGNVTLNKGEANLPKKSVVNISQIFTVNKSDLSEKLGTLSKQRIAQISDGVRLLTEPREID
jgi:mRNA interferase MazF